MVNKQEKMMQNKTKNLIKTSILIALILTVTYFVFISYLLTNGYKDHVKFCSKYIEQIDQHKNLTGQYPKNLNKLAKPGFSFRYNPKVCGYYAQKDFYGFAVAEKLIGVAFYSSYTKSWNHD